MFGFQSKFFIIAKEGDSVHGILVSL